MKKGHGRESGHQQEELLRELRGLRREIHDPRSATQDRPSLQSRINNAVALADREVGMGGPEFEFRNKSSYYSSSLSPTIPVPRSDSNPESPIPSLATVGVPGTPITSGFLLDLGEYNPELQGRLAIPIYEKMRRGDAQVRATLAACKLPVQSAKWDVIPQDVLGSSFLVRGKGGQNGSTNQEPRTKNSNTGAGKQTQAKAKEVAAFVKDNLFSGLEYRSTSGALVTQSWDEVVRNALLMLDFGCAVHEDVWTIDGDAIRLRRLASRHPLTYYQWVVEADGETLDTLIQYGYRCEQFLRVPLPAGKMCRFTYQQEAANFWGIALQRAMYPHWYVKDHLYRIDAIANERNALGIPVFKLAPGFSREDKAAAYNFVTQLATHEAAGLVEPPGDQYTGLRIVGYEGRLRDVMPSIQHHNTMISIAALAMFMQLGQEGKGGSRALGESHGSFFLLSLQNLADHIANAITRQTVRRLVAYNFGDGAPVPRLVAANVQSRDIAELAQTLTQFAQSGLAISDEDLRSFIRQELALPAESAALKGAVAAPRGLTIADENDIKSGGEIQGKSAGEIEGPGGAAEAKAEGKTKSSELCVMSDELKSTKLITHNVKRTTVSPFWADGYDPALRLVHPAETHVNFPAHQAELGRAETAVAGILSRAKPQIIRRAADKMAAALRAGRKPAAVAFDHDDELQKQIQAVVETAYTTAGQHVRGEHQRLRGSSKLGASDAVLSSESSKLKTHNSELLAEAQPRPSLIAEIGVQDFLADISNAARHAAMDLARQPDQIRGLSAGDLADRLFGAIDDVAYIDDGIDRIAGETARDAWRSGRSDEFQQLADEMAKQGLELHTIRTSVMEKNTCGPCASQDGEDWEPERRLSEICEGGELCQCELMETTEK